MLRNPDDQPREFALDVEAVFDLSVGAPKRYALKSAWAEDASHAAHTAEAGKPLALAFRPLEVVVLDANPLPAR